MRKMNERKRRIRYFILRIEIELRLDDIKVYGISKILRMLGEWAMTRVGG